MIGIEALGAVGASDLAGLATRADGLTQTRAKPSIGFGDLLTRGLGEVERKVDHADAMVRAFALDDSVPVHEVTIALEEARLSVDLAMQVRTRLVEAFREIMNTQL